AGPQDPRPTLAVAECKALIREQFFMLLIRQEAALAAIPSLLPPDAAQRRKAFAALREVVSARGDVSGEAAERLQQVGRLFGVEAGAAATPSKADSKIRVAKAS